MNQARRTVGCWLLTGLLERGCDSLAAVRGHHWEPARSVLPLSPAELRQLGFRPLKVHFLPVPRFHDNAALGIQL